MTSSSHSTCHRSITDSDRNGSIDIEEQGTQVFDKSRECSSNYLLCQTRVSNENKECEECKTSNVPMCHIKLEQLENLKNSTKKLLCLLEEVQEKTHSTALVPDDLPKIANTLRPLTKWDDNNCENLMDRSVTDIISFAAIKKLEKQTKDLDCIIIKDEDDDCSVYKRLTRKCHCLNQQEYNDFIIHFNEDTKFCTNTIGEIIKNMFIIKKFLYMGGIYTRHSLLFLNQGLEEGSHAEKAEIIQSCAFADICCIFDTYTIVTVCISWPCKNPNFMEIEKQEMAAKLLYNLAKLEEGRRYLNFNSKITCNIKKVIKKKKDKLNCDTIEMLEAVLNACQPHIQHTGMNSLTYHCRPLQEAVGNKTLNALIAYRQHMTLNEVFLHLDIIQSLSSNEETKPQLTPHLPAMLSLFKNMLLEFNNSDINIIITNVMNNIVGHSVAKNNENDSPIVVCETLTSCMATEPIKKKNVTIQVPVIAKRSQKKAHHHRHHLPRRTVADIIVNTAKKDINPTYPSKQQKDAIKLKVAPISNDVEKQKKWATSQKFYENLYHKDIAVYTALNRSRKFMGGVSFSNRQDKEVERRIENAWKSYWSMKELMKGNLSLTLKRKLVDMCILPVWSLTESQKSKLKITETSLWCPWMKKKEISKDIIIS